MRGTSEKIVRAFIAPFVYLGIIDTTRGMKTVDLAWPRILTGVARKSQQTADLAMVGLTVGPAAVAGIAFAFPYWSIASGFGTALTNGAIGLISQRYGADDSEGMDLVIKQSFLIGIVIAGPIALVYWKFAPELIGLLEASPAASEYGSTYLQVASIAIFLRFPNKIADRTLVGVGDAWTPMVFRTGGAVVNIVLNVLFIFGLGWGVFGAAFGTSIATGLVTCGLVGGLVVGRFPGFGSFPVQVRCEPPYLDLEITKQIVEVSAPLIVRRSAGRVAQFPLLVIVAQFGTVVVAAYEISRRARSLLKTPNWGISIAASSLVGQELGTGDEAEAEAFGWGIFRFSFVIYCLTALATFIFARQVGLLFTRDPETIESLVPFVCVAAISVIPLGLDGTATGVLRAGGDTRWPMYGRILGLYAFMLPIAYASVVTPAGIFAIYLALVAETVVPAVVTLYRFWRGKWITTSRKYRPESS